MFIRDAAGANQACKLPMEELDRLDTLGDLPGDDDERAPAIRRNPELAASYAEFAKGIGEVLEQRERK